MGQGDDTTTMLPTNASTNSLTDFEPRRATKDKDEPALASFPSLSSKSTNNPVSEFDDNSSYNDESASDSASYSDDVSESFDSATNPSTSRVAGATRIPKNFSTTSLSAAVVPLVGFGTFNEFKDADKVSEVVETAIHEGYRLFDCARLYQNEKQVGAAIKRCLKAGVVERDELFLVSKLWCWDAAPEDVEKACRASLDDLAVDYLDNYMLHWPAQMTRDSKLVSTEKGGRYEFEMVHSGDINKIMETYSAMERLVDAGVIRSIGLSNVGVNRLDEILQRCRIKPTIVEVEMHPYLQQPRLLNFCQEKEIHVVAYSPLGKISYRDKDSPNMLEDSVIEQIAAEAGRTPAQVLLRWNVQRGVSVIPKSMTPERVASNRLILDWALTPNQMQRIEELDRGFRFCTVEFFDIYEDCEYRVGGGHPACQPKRTPCTRDRHGGYRNKFERDGKELKTDILVQRGVLSRLAECAKDIIPECSAEAANYLVTDEVVDGLYGDMVIEGFRAAGFKMEKIVVKAAAMDESGEPSGEPFKNSDTFHYCVDTILNMGISKHSCIVSLGGGVVNNICGVMAATLYRGIKLVHITTTSMGMLDAAVDFKQAFNHGCGKNLIGAYYPADIVVMDPEVLTTLSDRHLLNGIAEALKHGLSQSMTLVKAIVEPLRKGGKETLHDGKYLEDLCRETIEVKVPTLTHYNESDFNEMVPQYGHCIAHAIEHLSWHGDQSPLLHGEAVAIGMCVTAEVAAIMGKCTQEVVEQHYDFTGATGLPIFVPLDMNVDEIMHTMTYDKHYVERPVMGLCEKIGVMAAQEDGSYAFAIEQDVIRQALENNINRARKAQKQQ